MALKDPTLYVLKPQREGGGKLLSVLCFLTVLIVILVLLLCHWTLKVGHFVHNYNTVSQL